VNEIFDPPRVDDVYSQDADVRADGLAQDKGTNYGVVRLELLEEIYSTMYSYRIRYENEQDWPLQILPHQTVTGMSEKGRNGGIRLHIQNDSGKYRARELSTTEYLDVDLVIVASGYRRDAHEKMLKGVRHLMPHGGQDSERWEVNRDYSVKFVDGGVAADAGVWLQGCNEHTHGLSDSLLSILATRGGEMVRNIFGDGIL
jgi:L-ornithine N5-monooxygenase